MHLDYRKEENCDIVMTQVESKASKSVPVVDGVFSLMGRQLKLNTAEDIAPYLADLTTAKG